MLGPLVGGELKEQGGEQDDLQAGDEQQPVDGDLAAEQGVQRVGEVAQDQRGGDQGQEQVKRLDAGDEVKQLDWTIRVVEGHPKNVFEVRFSRAIEALPVAIVTFDGFTDRLVPMPAVGEAMVLKQPAPPELYALDAPTQWLHAHFE